MKLSKRLDAIASYINDDDKVLDIGCDHAYLDIYLALEKNNQLIIASDISKDVIKSAEENIKKFNVEDKVKIICTDGTNNIKDNYDTVVIAGMGSNSIIKILNNTKKLKKIIICSNNNWDIIRQTFNNKDYHLADEKLVYEANKLYSIMLFKEGHKKRNKRDLMVGIYNKNNRQLYEKYLENIKRVYSKIPLKKLFKKISYRKKIKYLTKYLRKENG